MAICRLLFIMMMIFVISSCGKHQPAPIVDGWRQPAASIGKYTVQKGDTLYSIAWAFNMDFRDLAHINHIQPPYALNVGQQLRMSNRAPVNVTLPRSKTYAAKTTPIPIKASNRTTSAPATTTANYTPVVNQPVKGWLWPAKGRVVKGFSPKMGGNRGIDITGQLGEPVIAAAAGKVVYSGSALRGYGNLIIIKHNDTFLSAYAYNKALLVKEGTPVKAGQTIAYMGSNAGQTLLHFEIRRNGKPVNPMTFLR